MSALRLTSKLLAEIDDQLSPDAAATPSPLGDWYGHIFTIERHKCIMFINEPTLFVCPSFDVVKANYRQIGPFFLNVLAQALRTLDFTKEEIDWILGKHSEMTLARATNRSTLGSLNNRVADSKALIACDGGFSISDIGSLTKWLNKTPMKPIGYSNGLEQMRSVVDGRHLATAMNDSARNERTCSAQLTRPRPGKGVADRKPGETGTKQKEETAMKKAKLIDVLYQFKITLLDSKPPIWRRIQVKDGTLDKLHEHIQTAMGWTNSHLHQFKIGDAVFGDPMLMEEDFEEQGFEDSTETMLSALIPKGCKPFAFEYEYDFGDSWNHKIAFEGFPNLENGVKYPLCLEGERACPPEDVGGVPGYDEFLRAIADPKHEEHETFLKWAGGAFDSEKFSATAATKRMRQGLPNWREMA